MSTREVRQLHQRMVDVLEETTGSLRDRLNRQIQGYILSQPVIYKEMIHKKSPFKWPTGEGLKLSNDLIRPISERVSLDLYNTYKSWGISNYRAEPIRSTGFGGNFYDSSRITVAYDDAKRIIYYSGVGDGDNYESFRNFMREPITAQLVSGRPPGDHTRVFVEPNATWAAMDIEARNNAEASYRERTIAKGKVPKQKSIEANRTAASKRLRETNLDYEGLDAGHILGPGARIAALFTDSSIDDLDINNLQAFNLLPSEIKADIINIVEKILTEDTKLELRREVNATGVTGEVVFTAPEEKFRNKSSGGKIGTPIGQLRVFATRIEGETQAIMDAGGSPSFAQLLTQYIETIFLGKRTKNKKFYTQSKIKIKSKQKIRLAGISGRKGTIRFAPREDGTGLGGSLRTRDIIVLLNSRMHDKVQLNMGKGKSKSTLNYRTGRFARSARVQSLHPGNTRNSLLAHVSYMKNPYSIFEPAGKLNPPVGRDPARIFSKSIRQILQEYAIANLGKVKVELSDK